MSVVDELRGAFLTSGLDDDQLEELAACSTEVAFDPGEELFHEGRPADLLFILLDGEIQLTRHIGQQTTKVATMSAPGQWAGGLAAWGSGPDAVYRASGTAISAGRCLTVPAADLAALLERWSPFAKHLVTGVYQTVRSIDATARERESLVALGSLSARLAHEINNPASASLRAVESLQNTAQYMLSALVRLAEEGVLAEEFLALDRLRLELVDGAPPEESAVARSDREESIGTWLEDHEVQPAWRMAPVLANAGVDPAWLAKIETAVGPAALEPAAQWLTSAVGMAALLTELADATNRVTHLVEDIKNYSNMDRADLQRVDVRTGITSTLAMLAPKLEGVEVVHELDPDLPDAEVYAAELNQVWTNLIDNAIDAMGGAGTLRVRAFVESGDLVVEVVDSGAGIDPTVQAHVFEPFFTTKDVGAGTGLGLDISRRIVEDRHGGSITLHSEPGATTARVRLPLHR